MRRIAISVFFSFLLAPLVFAHGGKSHDVMGIVAMLGTDHIMIKTTDDREVTIHLTPQTKFSKAGKPAALKSISTGTRVIVHMTEDGKNAVTVKIGSSKKTSSKR